MQRCDAAVRTWNKQNHADHTNRQTHSAEDCSACQTSAFRHSPVNYTLGFGCREEEEGSVMSSCLLSRLLRLLSPVSSKSISSSARLKKKKKEAPFRLKLILKRY